MVIKYCLCSVSKGKQAKKNDPCTKTMVPQKKTADITRGNIDGFLISNRQKMPERGAVFSYPILN